jgi:hypothetical protein
MALTSKGFYLHVTLVDQGGNRAVLRYDLTGVDFATATANATNILAELAGVTDAAVWSYNLGEAFEDGAISYGGGEVENVASISARIDSTEQKYATIRIPAPSDGIFSAAGGPGYNIVDPADVDLLAYLATFETGEDALLSDGEALDTVATAGNVTGKRIHRKSRKG